MPPLITVTHRHGIYVPEADLWLDPHFGVQRAFISHAHADHVARHQVTFCSDLTLQLMEARFGLKKDGLFHALPMRTIHEWEGWEMRLLPAGHILGSAMLHLTRKSDGATLLYTGDYKLRQGLSSERCELLAADTLIMETTFGLPQFHFPPVSQVVAELLKFVQETLEDGGIPVLLGYSLGKAQEILCALAGAGYPVMLHKSVHEMTEVVKSLLRPLPEYRLFEASSAKGHVLIFPPSHGKSLLLKKLKVCRTAMFSGWALQSGAKYRYQVDEVFPLSDHADYPELLETVALVKPRCVYLVHGYTQQFAADLRGRGVEAWTLEKADQMELTLTTAAEEPSSVVAQSVMQSHEASGLDGGAVSADVSGFSAWVHVCVSTATESSRLNKVALLAAYLRGLEEADLMLAVRYCSGMTSDPAAADAPLNTGWALIRRALQELSGVSDVEYRSISRSQADAGRTAFLVLQRAPLQPAPWSLSQVAVFFDLLRQTSSQVVRVTLLSDQFSKRSAEAGAWLVRLMTSDLRMGSKEGLIEEAVAAAFEQKVDTVREAAMLCGDLGRAAVLAKGGRLHEVAPRAFVPIKVMLASPEETAGAIWERMNVGKADTFWLEDKYDGIRAQAHALAGRAEMYTRDSKLISDQFPEITEVLRSMAVDVILDGEIIAYADGKKLTFFDLQKRLGRKDQADLFMPSDIRVRYVVFDLLWLNGASFMEHSLSVRRTALEQLDLPEEIALIDIHRAGSTEEIEAAFLAARRRGNEGLIAKEATGAYTPGRRGKSWLKLKKAFATLDVVVVKAEQGHGKRSHVLSDYTFAVRDDTQALRVIGKAYSGLTDTEIEKLTEHFTQNTLSENGRVRTVVPDTVLEIAFDSIQASKRHDSGLALRFPRIKAIRSDKRPDEIDTLAYAQKLAGLS